MTTTKPREFCTVYLPTHEIRAYADDTEPKLFPHLYSQFIEASALLAKDEEIAHWTNNWSETSGHLNEAQQENSRLRELLSVWRDRLAAMASNPVSGMISNWAAKELVHLDEALSGGEV
jgi:hypothetical protein